MRTYTPVEEMHSCHSVDFSNKSTLTQIYSGIEKDVLRCEGQARMQRYGKTALQTNNFERM